MRKDARLCPVLFRFLLSHWPLTLDHKSELFIDECTQVLDETLEKDVDDIIEDLLEYVAFAAESSSMTLAEKALVFLQNNRIKVAISHHPEKLMKMLFPSLYRVAKDHWHRNVQLLALQVMNSLMLLDQTAFKKVTGDFKAAMMAEAIEKSNKKKLWLEIANIAIRKDPRIIKENVERDMDAYFGVSPK